MPSLKREEDGLGMGTPRESLIEIGEHLQKGILKSYFPFGCLLR